MLMGVSAIAIAAASRYDYEGLMALPKIRLVF
jgi:hypothetical protein